MTSIAQRQELQNKIWKIANDVRGSVDGWDFKQFVLGTLFYRYISEHFTNYIEGGDDSIDYANLSDEDIATMQKIELPTERAIQDYRSTYNDIRDWLRREKQGEESKESTLDWDDVVFEVDLLKSQEINLDYILELIFEHNKKNKDKAALIEDIRRVIRASIGNRAKESLIVDFMNQTDLDTIHDKATIIDTFFTYAQEKQKTEANELIADENLNEEAAKRYITTSLKREYASENGTELNEILPKMSPLNPQYLTKKQKVFQKISAFVEKYKGVGGQL
ncbi:MAG: type I restriction endonuclease subunit R, EcoR124 family [Niabella sp.]